MSKILSSILLTAVAVPLLLTGCGKSTPSAKRASVRQATMRRVETNGDYLRYCNLSAIMAKVSRAPEFAADAAKAFNAKPQEQEIAREAARIFVRLCNFQAVRAQAESSVEYAPGCHRMKHFCYLGKAMKEPSIFSLFGKNNRKLDWKQLPADTRIAMNVTIDGSEFYTRLIAECSASTVPEFQVLPAQIALLKNKQGIDVEAIIRSLNGKFFLCVAGNDLNTLAFQLTIPDQDGVIAAMLKKMMPPAKGSNIVRIPFPMPPETAAIKPVLVYGEKEIRLLSCDTLLKPPAKTLGQTEPFSKLALPENGNCYLFMYFDAPTIANLAALLPQKEQRQLLLKYLKPHYLLSVGTVETDGYLTTTLSDFSVPDAQLIAPGIPVAASTFLQAVKAQKNTPLKSRKTMKVRR